MRAAIDDRVQSTLQWLWSLSVHYKTAGNDEFLEGLELIERESGDERNFVKKAVNMALRAIGKRNAVLGVAAIEVARRLAASDDATARWIGKDALRELKPAVTKSATPKRRTAAA